MKLKLALIVLLIIAALLVSGCCCCVLPTHRGYYRIPSIMHHDWGPCSVKVTATAVPITTAIPTPMPIK